MRYLVVTCLGALICLSGCAAESRPATAAGKLPAWPQDMSPADVRSLTPDECKAILVARAALESSTKSEIHAHFRVAKQGSDWVVTVSYTAPPGQGVPPGRFTGVIVAPDWSVKDIIGGA